MHRVSDTAPELEQLADTIRAAVKKAVAANVPADFALSVVACVISDTWVETFGFDLDNVRGFSEVVLLRARRREEIKRKTK